MTEPPDTSPRSSPPRRSRKKTRTREEIFRAGLALIESEGFEAVSVPRICEAADVARATFFLHFRTKSHLLVELNVRLAAELRERLAARPGRFTAEYRMAVDLIAERWPRQPGALVALLGELLAPPALDASRSAGQDLRRVVEEIVRRGQQRGELRRNLSPRLAATLFLSAAAAILSGAVFGEGEASPEEMRNQLLHAVLHGLQEPKPRLKWRARDEPGRPG